MNKKYIPGVIIVEGTHDVSKLSTLYESNYVVTNGYDIPEEEIKFLNALDKDTQVIILTDKDEAGKKIRERLNSIKPNVINIEIEAPNSSKKKGVAECSILDIEKALDKYVSNKELEKEYNLYELGIIGKDNSKEIRRIISNKFNLGLVNKNNMIKRLNLLHINLEELEKEIKYATSK